MISIVDYGVGNTKSIIRMFEKLGVQCKVTNEKYDIVNSNKIILPGVGHFDYAMKNLKKFNLIDTLHTAVFMKKIPILGICLGMQLLCNKSEEGNEDGLSFVNANVKKFSFNSDSKLKIPHMGWNVVYSDKKNVLFNSNTELRFYFVHSYYVIPNDDIVIATSQHGIHFCASFNINNIFGVQFHPEKSHKFGVQLLKNFINL